MKNIKILILTLAAIALGFSCKKSNADAAATDNTVTNNIAQKLIGKWEVQNTTITISNKESGAIISLKQVDFPIKQWEFRQDNNLYLQNGNLFESIPFRLESGNKLFLNYLNTTQTMEANFQGGKIFLVETISLNDGTLSRETLELTKM